MNPSEKDFQLTKNTMEFINSLTNPARYQLIKESPIVKDIISISFQLTKFGIAKRKVEIKYNQKLEALMQENSIKDLEEEKTLISDYIIDPKKVFEEKNVPICYMCKNPIIDRSEQYEQLCQSCGELSINKKSQKVNLTGKISLVTGGRVKIGFQTSLQLLRFGSTVIITTRFAKDALERYQREQDYPEWKDRLIIIRLDFRNMNAVQNFIEFVKNKFNRLDILINNAAQTVRRPTVYYLPFIEKEKKELPDSNLIQYLSKENYYLQNNNSPNSKNEIQEIYEIIPQMKNQSEKIGLNLETGEPLDSREENSWIQTMDKIHFLEFAEVQVINQMVPYLLIKELKPIMTRKEVYSYIINVTGTEGNFSVTKNSSFHPHTNMAKAAMNMLTFTIAEDYKKSNILVNSVDTGWISDEAPEPKKLLRTITLLPIMDAVFRILDPIILSMNENNHQYGGLFKNYNLSNW